MSSPGKARQLVLIDVPFFDVDTRRKFFYAAAQPPGFTPDIESLAPAWDRGIAKRIDSEPKARTFEMFVEQLCHGEAMNAAFAAARDYDVEAAAHSLRHDAALIGTKSGLLKGTRKAARHIYAMRDLPNVSILIVPCLMKQNSPLRNRNFGMSG